MLKETAIRRSYFRIHAARFSRTGRRVLPLVSQDTTGVDTYPYAERVNLINIIRYSGRCGCNIIITDLSYCGLFNFDIVGETWKCK